MLIATAGHVDHGKTSLLQRLTGVNTDSLPEEKKRGMTIDIGFAYLPVGDRVLGFIDVPGHERFLGNMLAGVAGIDMALLVIACDDAIMPQTREHLTILRLLGIKRWIIALTKCDLVDAQRIEQLTRDIHQELDTDCTVQPVSSHTGQGIEELKSLLLAQPEEAHQARNEKFRLAIDRVFTLSGAGLVVTGTVFSGQVSVGDSLWLTSTSSSVRVRSLHAMNQNVQQAHAGQRLALNLVGDVEKQDIHRGDWLLAQVHEPSHIVDVCLQVSSEISQSLTHWQSVHIYAAAAHTTGHLALLEESSQDGWILARLHLATPIYCVVGDRLIVRDGSAQQTLAGARVLDPYPPTRGQRRPERLALLKRLSHADACEALQAWSEQAGVRLADFAQAYNVEQTQVIDWAQSLSLHVVNKQMVFMPEKWEALQQNLLDKLAIAHENMPDQAGVSSERLHRLACPALPQEAFIALREELLQTQRLLRQGPWLHLPGFSLALNTQEDNIWQSLLPHFNQTSEPIWVRDLAQAEGLDEHTVRELLKKVARMGKIAAIVRDRYLLMSAVHQLAEVLRQLAQQDSVITAARFRDQIGVGRKLAVQILEFFDRSGLTRRFRDHHVLRDAAMFNESDGEQPPSSV